MQLPLAPKFLLENTSQTKVEGERGNDVQVGRARTWRTSKRLKVIIDYALTIPTIILILPLLIVIAIAIKLESPGPIIYRRRVLGLNGRTFDAFKFRTMYVNSDQILACNPRLRGNTLKCDPRVTRVGNFLRQFNLDELPQLFNVLNQDMSLIGPRVITADEISKYGKWSNLLLTVLPGLTGLWQVSGRSNNSYQKRVELDIEYINNWSVLLDIRILLRTVLAVLKGNGAY